MWLSVLILTLSMDLAKVERDENDRPEVVPVLMKDVNPLPASLASLSHLLEIQLVWMIRK